MFERAHEPLSEVLTAQDVWMAKLPVVHYAQLVSTNQ